jgi:ribonuclease T
MGCAALCWTSFTLEFELNCLQKNLANRFRGFLPIVIDVETGGLQPHSDALLEVAAVFLGQDENGQWYQKKTLSFHVAPFPGARLDPKSLAFNKIDPFHPFRFAKDEKEVLKTLFQAVKEALKETRCNRAVLVGHNAWFDLLFIKAAAERNQLDLPFHAFTSFDTASLAGLFFGQTVLAKALEKAGIEFDTNEAHSALYDAEKTAELFCLMVNQWDACMK